MGKGLEWNTRCGKHGRLVGRGREGSERAVELWDKEGRKQKGLTGVEVNRGARDGKGSGKGEGSANWRERTGRELKGWKGVEMDTRAAKRWEGGGNRGVERAEINGKGAGREQKGCEGMGAGREGSGRPAKWCGGAGREREGV